MVAQPVINGGDVTGAVVTMSPTDRLRRSVARDWLALVLGELLAVIGCALLASRLTRWILRPVRDVDVAAHAIATGRMTARALDGTGPPELRRLTSSFNEMAANVEGSCSASATSSPTPRTSCATRSARCCCAWTRSRCARPRAVRPRSTPPPARAATSPASSSACWPWRRPRRPSRCRRGSISGRSWTAGSRRGGRRPSAKGMTIDRGGGRHARGAGRSRRPLERARRGARQRDQFGPAGSSVRVTVQRDGGRRGRRRPRRGSRPWPGRAAPRGDRFWRGRRHQNVDGSGLGLAIAARCSSRAARRSSCGRRGGAGSRRACASSQPGSTDDPWMPRRRGPSSAPPVARRRGDQWHAGLRSWCRGTSPGRRDAAATGAVSIAARRSSAAAARTARAIDRAARIASR